ncbi:type II toxin-antitoxin system VapC family toxin [Acidisoma cladoniae]|uniref:type II toxin-antitoxin system VapC family toxin n=1 Tax=Acidisoma cladoniae TaxID=3040935 RepID=UPI00254BA8D5|nr:type II toxin-antitoxin system VapC family toxin [Acidisoma sp. PAMC 29798]
MLDTSYTSALVLDEGDVPDVAEVTEQIATEGAHVPALWRFEVANVLLMAVRRKRIAPTLPALIVADLEALPISIDNAATSRAWTTTYTLAERHGLTLYDGAYLELAIRLELPIASRDGDLILAARREKIRVLGG